MAERCLHCGDPLETSLAFFCSSRCRQRAYRRRLRGVPQNAAPSGARRGQLLELHAVRELTSAMVTARPK